MSEAKFILATIFYGFAKVLVLVLKPVLAFAQKITDVAEQKADKKLEPFREALQPK